MTTTLGQHAVAAMAGFPAPKPRRTRRGGGRHKTAATKGAAPKSAPHVQHKTALDSALATGNHAAASNHALNLANALKKMSAKAPAKPPAVPPDGPSMPPTGSDDYGM